MEKGFEKLSFKDQKQQILAEIYEHKQTIKALEEQKHTMQAFVIEGREITPLYTLLGRLTYEYYLRKR